MRFPHFRTTAVFIALIAFALRSVIPAGFMPDTSGHKALIICDGIHHNLMHKSTGGGTSSSVCPFAVAAISSFADLALPPIVLPVFAPVPHEVAWVAQAFASPAFSHGSPRSPPSFS